jgi:hypothetical protein
MFMFLICGIFSFVDRTVTTNKDCFFIQYKEFKNVCMSGNRIEILKYASQNIDLYLGMSYYMYFHDNHVFFNKTLAIQMALTSKQKPSFYRSHCISNLNSSDPDFKLVSLQLLCNIVDEDIACKFCIKMINDPTSSVFGFSLHFLEINGHTLIVDMLNDVLLKRTHQIGFPSADVRDTISKIEKRLASHKK